MSEQQEGMGWSARYMDASSSVDKDASIGEGTGNDDQGVTLNNEVVKKLLSALSDGTFATHRIKVREPDLFYGERSSLAVTTWLDCLKTYFELTRLNNSEKMLYAVTLLRGDAQLWWSRTKTSSMAPKHWDAFCVAFAREFKPLNSELAARDKLAALYQHGSVSRYITEFRSIQLQLADLSKGDALDKFVRGLKKNIRVAVRARFPSSLETAESMALAIESAAGELTMPYSQEQMAVGNRNVIQPTIPAHSDPYQDDPMDLDTIRQALNAIAYSRSNRNMRSSYQQGRQQVRCFGCQGYGHIKSECPTWRKNSSDNRRGGRFTRNNMNNNKTGHLNSVVPLKNQSSQAPLSHTSVNLDCDMDNDNLAKDQSYILNIENKETDLPLYEFGINVGNVVHAVKALLDTGASANYISPRLVNDGMKVTPLRQARQVETAGGHVSNIKHKVEFSLIAQGLQYKMQAYVFEMKFDVILGQEWFRDARPVPDWVNSTWLLPARNGVGEVSLSPIQVAASVPQDLVYLISKKQVQRIIKKNKTDEIYLVHFSNSVQEDKEQCTARVTLQRELLNEFNDVFRNDLPPGLPPVRMVEHVIDTGDSKPISRPPFKMSPRELDELQKQLKELLSLGLIRPSSSPWGAPVLFVRKKDGTLRMCIDYRAVNSLTRRLNTPLPRIDECLERLGGSKYFSSIDLKSGYHQVRIKDMDIAKTAFNTRYGSFEFLVLPFGLTNSPPTFQKMMNAVLEDYLDKFVLVYLDDILVYSKSEEEHLEHLRLVLHKLRENKLFANPKKCIFNQTSVEFLGYRVSAEGILPSESKIVAVKDWPQPTNVQEVRQFVGLCSHYRRFIPGFSSVAAPLTDLTKGVGAKRRSIEWSSVCQDAFDKLKALMTSSPVLQHPDLGKPFVIETDASDFGVGAVLLQRDDNDVLHPLAYESKKLSSTEKGYPIQERELLAVLHALRTWRCFVDGADYIVYTDHNPLQYLRSQTKPTPRLVRWISEIETYSPTIKYKPGKENGVPDALSRCCDADTSGNTLNMEPDYLYVAKELSEADWPLYYNLEMPNNISDVMKQRIARERDKFVVQDGQVWRKVKVGQSVSLVQFCPFSRRADLVSQFHEGFGHAGQATVFDLLKTRWWWPTMRLDLNNWLSSCRQCQLAAGAGKGKHHAPMIPSDVPSAFARWHLDFVGELPTTKRGNRWLLTAVDFATNWPIARAVPDATAEAVADFIYEEIVMRFGCPAEIVTDRGANFTSKLVKQYTDRVKVTHKLTSAFHPRTNGKCERLNGVLKVMLRKYVHGAIHMWDEFVDAVLFAARVRKHRSAGYSPFFLVYGREPVLPGDLLRPYLISDVANDPRTVAEHTARELEELGQVRAAAKKRMLAVSEYDKNRWDAAIIKVDFEIGDHVLLRNEQKYGLEYNWMGPFLVVDKNEKTNIYKLVSVGGEPYNSWVHVDRLKEVKAEEIKEPWYNPTVSRAAWRAEMGLSSGAAVSSGVVGSSGVAGVAVDRGRSQSLGGNDVVSKVRRFKPTVSTGSRKHCRGSRPDVRLRLNNIHANGDCH